MALVFKISVRRSPAIKPLALDDIPRGRRKSGRVRSWKSASAENIIEGFREWPVPEYVTKLQIKYRN